LKLKYDEPLSNFAFKFDLRRYGMVMLGNMTAFLQFKVWTDG